MGRLGDRFMTGVDTIPVLLLAEDDSFDRVDLPTFPVLFLDFELQKHV